MSTDRTQTHSHKKKFSYFCEMANSCSTLIFFLCSSKCAQIICGWSHGRNITHSWWSEKRPRSASHGALSYQNALLSITCTKIPNSDSLKLTPLQQLRVQQASRQITACDHDRTNNPPPPPLPPPLNITWSNTEVLPMCVKASPVSDSPCGFVDCVLRGMLIRLGGAIPWARRGSAHERRFIKTYVKWTCGWLRAWYPLLWSSLEEEWGEGRGVPSAFSALRLTATGSGQSGASAATHQSWNPQPAVFSIALSGTPPIHGSSLLFAVFLFFFFTVLQLFIYLVKHRSGLHLAVKCLMGGEVRFYKLVETSGFVAKEQREAKRRHNSKTNQQTNKKKWFIQTSDSCTIPKTLFAGPFFKSNNWSIDSWQNILRDTSALTDKIQKCYNKVIISPVKGFFLFFFSPQALGFFHIPYEWKISHLKYPFSHVRDTFISFLSPQCGNAEPDNQTMAGELCIPYEFHILAYFPLIQSFCIWTGHFHKSVTVLHMNKKSPNWRFHMWITYSVFICDCDSHTWKFYSTRHYQQDSILCQCLPKPFKVYAAE